MKHISYSTLPFIHVTPEEAVKKSLAHGADKVEVFMEGPGWSNLKQSEREELAVTLNHLPCEYSVHPPPFDLNLASEWSAVRKTAINEYSRAIEFAGWINASHVVIDPGIRHLNLTDLPQARMRAKDGIETLLPLAEKYKVKIGIENGGSKRQYLFDEKEYVSFVKHFDHDLIGAVIDTGHAQLTRWNIPEVITDLSKDLIALHLNDTSGNVDNHLPLGEGVIMWEEVFNALRKSKGEPDFVLELNTQATGRQMKESKAFILEHVY